MLSQFAFWIPLIYNCLKFFDLRILERRNQLLSEIKEVRRTRALQRAARKRHGGADGQSLATVAVVGYTNAVGDQNSPRTALNLTLLQYHYVIITFSRENQHWSAVFQTVIYTVMTGRPHNSCIFIF